MNQTEEKEFSRQLGVIYDDESFKKIRDLNILIYGFGGVGVEITKNLMLQKINKISIYDTEYLSDSDFQVNIFAKQEDKGIKLRHEACLPYLKQFKNDVLINTLIEEPTNKEIYNYDVIILTLIYETEKIIKLNEICRNNPYKKTGFIFGGSLGLFNFAFVDFGNSFNVLDTGNKQKNKRNMLFKSFSETLKNPYPIDEDFLETVDFSNKLEPEILFLLLKSLIIFISQNKEINLNFNKEQKEIFLQIFKNNFQNNNFVTNIDESKNDELILNFLIYFKTEFVPCCSMIGAFLTQEIMKIIGVYTPLNQWLFFDFYAMIENTQKLDYSQLDILKKNKYFNQIYLFGYEFQSKLENLKLCLIGCGALGCEVVKNLALMGACSSKNGLLNLIDNDCIELSNLSRQLLFSNEDLGKSKSEIAASKALTINASINIKSYLEKFERNSHLFNEYFIQNQDLFILGVDNIKTRKIVDEICVENLKSFLDAGTSGLHCQTRTIIAEKTNNFDEKDLEEIIPECTLKLFPNKIEHIIGYIVKIFEENFNDIPNEMIRFFKDKHNFMESSLNKHDFLSIKKNLKIIKSLNLIEKQSKENMISYILETFNEMFNYHIESILKMYPEDYKTESGSPFWNDEKKMPKVIIFNYENDEHIKFIFSFKKLLNLIFGLNIEFTQDDIKIYWGLNHKDFIDNKLNDRLVLKEEFEKIKIQNDFLIKPKPYDKDDPIDLEFIHFGASLRAQNFSISKISKSKTRIISGKITPAIITSTSLAVGFQMMELIKYLLNCEISLHKNLNAELRFPKINFNEIIPPNLLNQNEDYKSFNFSNQFNIWTQIDIKKDKYINIQNLVLLIEEKFNLKITSIFLQFKGMNKQIYKEKINKMVKFLETYLKLSIEEIFPDHKGINFFKLDVFVDSGIKIIKLPIIKYYLN